MKVPVRVSLLSHIVEPGGEVRETRHSYDGTWYRQPTGDYLVYVDEGIHTTLRWDPREVRLYRRGDAMEAYQLFRTDHALDFELALGGNKLEMTTTTHRMTTRTDQDGGEIVLEYSLFSGDTDLGIFTLTIKMAVTRGDR
ncbi:MAG: DUF1934 family protein [Candidatus Sericytochromatia bacterium]|uniref:DUF1934 family protein n=1 Tax=Candidatus Tanganyikabacteria bacterium TaxID=2961651 RepID=A0A937X1U6_9BACT|nr:DUF1934 family protein [Candidatus Tanganyikabacteria bacterium]